MLYMLLKVNWKICWRYYKYLYWCE